MSTRKCRCAKKRNSYKPAINNMLVSLRSRNRSLKIQHCNDVNRVPFEIQIENGECVPVDSCAAKCYLLEKLKMNKHLNMETLVLPTQQRSNCWFNTFMICLFISDKGRKFFHFLRSLMILGELPNGDRIPKRLRNGFALFNYYIESCLTNNSFSYGLDTNVLIKFIYENIPPQQTPGWIVNTDEPGDPVEYLWEILQYLGNKSLKIAYITDLDLKNRAWSRSRSKSRSSPYDVLIVQFPANNFRAKYELITFDNKDYVLDSICCLQHGHYVCLFMANGKPLLFDGDVQTKDNFSELNWKAYLDPKQSRDFALETSNTDHYFNLNTCMSYLFYYRI